MNPCSNSQKCFRNLPKTLYFLDRQFGAVEFPYLNKVGHNSYPNAVPLWFGKSVEDIDKTMFGLDVEKEEWSSICKNRSLYKNIMEEFKEYGYKVSLSLSIFLLSSIKFLTTRQKTACCCCY